jgi:hypothetical protein
LTVMSTRDTNHQQMSAVRSVQCAHLDQLHLIDVIVARSLAHKTSTVYVRVRARVATVVVMRRLESWLPHHHHRAAVVKCDPLFAWVSATAHVL